jgi:hypothetical protein
MWFIANSVILLKDMPSSKFGQIIGNLMEGNLHFVQPRQAKSACKKTKTTFF